MIGQTPWYGLWVLVGLGDHHWGPLWLMLTRVGDDHGPRRGHLLTCLGDDHWSPSHQGGAGLRDLYGVEDGPPRGQNLMRRAHNCLGDTLGLWARNSHCLQIQICQIQKKNLMG